MGNSHSFVLGTKQANSARPATRPSRIAVSGPQFQVTQSQIDVPVTPAAAHDTPPPSPRPLPSEEELVHQLSAEPFLQNYGLTLLDVEAKRRERAATNDAQRTLYATWTTHTGSIGNVVATALQQFETYLVSHYPHLSPAVRRQVIDNCIFMHHGLNGSRNYFA